MPDNCPFDVNPLSEPLITKNENFSNVNYTNQDFWSLKNRLVDFIGERFGENGNTLPNTFNDLVEGSIAIMLIENWAFIGDTLSFKIDQIVNELFIDTVTEPDNAFRLCKLVGFEPTPPIPSRALFTATINTTYDQDITLPAPLPVDVISDGAQIKYELFPADAENNPIFNQDIIISSGTSVNSAIVGLQGSTTVDERTGTGAILQSYETRFASVIYDSVSVKVDGAEWERVDYFTDSQPRKEFRVEYDSDYRAYVMFGNNKVGLSPANGSDIEITYRIGGGTIGNIVTGSVNIQRQARVFGNDFNVPVFISNYTKGEFGYDGDTVEDIRAKLPLYLRTQNRAVTGSDYKNLTDQFVSPYHGQIGKSTAVLRNQGCSGNVVDIYILAKLNANGLQEANDELKNDLSEMLEEKKMITDFICLKNGQIIETDVSVVVEVPRTERKFEQEIRQNIEVKINDFFSLSNWDYGQTLKDSDLIKSLSAIKSAKSFDVIYTTNDEDNSGIIVTAKFYEIIRPDTIEISFMYV